MGNYRFHYHVTGNTIVELAAELQQRRASATGKISAYVSAMGSAGTIAAGDRLKQVWPDHKIVGLEPIQCPTLYNNGYGSHDIQGIGDKHVTWIHNVLNMDALMCIDDMECKKGLQVFAEAAGARRWSNATAMDAALVEQLSTLFGISGICNILGAIKTAKYYKLGKDDVIVDGRHRRAWIVTTSVMDDMAECYGRAGRSETVGRVESIFQGMRTDWVLDGTADVRERWHNLKYYTWVEQQGKTVQELDAQRDPAWWEHHQARGAGNRRAADGTARASRCLPRLCFPEDRVLVGVIQTKRDLAFARVDHWYRIPQAQMPRGITTEYLAFFLSGKVFGENSKRFSITRRCARGWNWCYRKDLLPNEAEHPRANEVYYRVALGDLEAKTPPITNPTRRPISFIYTTWDRFVHAQTIADLYSRMIFSSIASTMRCAITG